VEVEVGGPRSACPQPAMEQEAAARGAAAAPRAAASAAGASAGAGAASAAAAAARTEAALAAIRALLPRSRPQLQAPPASQAHGNLAAERPPVPSSSPVTPLLSPLAARAGSPPVQPAALSVSAGVQGPVGLPAQLRRKRLVVSGTLQRSNKAAWTAADGAQPSASSSTSGGGSGGGGGRASFGAPPFSLLPPLGCLADDLRTAAPTGATTSLVALAAAATSAAVSEEGDAAIYPGHGGGGGTGGNKGGRSGGSAPAQPAPAAAPVRTLPWKELVAVAARRSEFAAREAVYAAAAARAAAAVSQPALPKRSASAKRPQGRRKRKRVESRKSPDSSEASGSDGDGSDDDWQPSRQSRQLLERRPPRKLSRKPPLSQASASTTAFGPDAPLPPPPSCLTRRPRSRLAQRPTPAAVLMRSIGRKLKGAKAAPSTAVSAINGVAPPKSAALAPPACLPAVLPAGGNFGAAPSCTFRSLPAAGTLPAAAHCRPPATSDASGPLRSSSPPAAAPLQASSGLPSRIVLCWRCCVHGRRQWRLPRLSRPLRRRRCPRSAPGRRCCSSPRSTSYSAIRPSG